MIIYALNTRIPLTSINSKIKTKSFEKSHTRVTIDRLINQDFVRSDTYSSFNTSLQHAFYKIYLYPSRSRSLSLAVYRSNYCRTGNRMQLHDPSLIASTCENFSRVGFTVNFWRRGEGGGGGRGNTLRAQAA